MRMQEETRADGCFPMDAAPANVHGFRRLGPKSRRDSRNLLMKNSILYCLDHPDCACGDFWIDLSRMTPRATG